MNLEEKNKDAPHCSCGEKTVFVFFNTFNYYYCRKCKVEVSNTIGQTDPDWITNQYFY